MTTRFAATCWSCGYAFDAHSAVGDRDAVPKPGDFSICLACGEVATYVAVLGALAMREPTPAERALAMSDQVVMDTILAQRVARERAGSWPRGPRDRPNPD